MPKKLTMFSFLLIFTLIFAGCSNKKEGAVKKDEKLSVYTTIFPLADFAKKIGGDYITVKAIYPPGADSHTFEPSQKQTVKIAKADLFIYNGAELEPFAEKMEKTLQKENVKIVNASKGIELRAATEDEHHDHGDGHKEDEHHHDKDPHVWLDPILAMKQAEKIKNALVEIQPNHKQEFEKNFAALQTKFTDLDDQFKAAVANAKTKEILVSHAAYGYWEQRYGLKQIPIAGISASDEPSQKELGEITKTVKEHGLKYILFETFSTPKVASVIQKETGTKVLRLNHLATISEDDAKNNKDYFTLMEENVNALKEATQFALVAEKLSEKQEQTTESHTHENEHNHSHSHSHSHAHDKATKRIYEGYFEDNQVKDRPLSDWKGDWQSVYPYLQDGTLDEVFAHKAKHKGKMSAKEYKEYYNEGYQTDVDRIVIQGDTVTFYKNKEKYSGKYIYDGYKILTYDAGNRGVRYIFKLADKTEGVPQYIQFSDHGIYPNKADHYHLYWGDNREALFDEVIHWPTYYPSDMDGHDIAHEMMAH